MMGDLFANGSLLGVPETKSIVRNASGIRERSGVARSCRLGVTAFKRTIGLGAEVVGLASGVRNWGGTCGRHGGTICTAAHDPLRKWGRYRIGTTHQRFANVP